MSRFLMVVSWPFLHRQMLSGFFLNVEEMQLNNPYVTPRPATVALQIGICGCVDVKMPPPKTPPTCVPGYRFSSLQVPVGSCRSTATSRVIVSPSLTCGALNSRLDNMTPLQGREGEDPLVIRLNLFYKDGSYNIGGDIWRPVRSGTNNILLDFHRMYDLSSKNAMTTTLA
ncbi:hypothetical protein AX15_005893 [Amanita polypyramis BW_CC]|nr:hypothetical protein AX15_005893 [Amanita polypyramis BW_CC]